MSRPTQESAKNKLIEVSTNDAVRTARPAVLLSVHDEFSSVEAIWRQFEKTADCFAFQTFDFLSTWYEHIGSRAQIDVQIVVAWGTSAKPLMILPLGIEKRGAVRKLIWLGNDINDYNAPLLAPNFADHVPPGEFAALWTDIQPVLSPHDFVELMRQPAMVEGQANPFLELDTQLNASGAHITILGNDFDAYYERKRSKKAKRTFLRNRRKLEELGETTYVHPETRQDIEASIDRLVTLKSDALNAMGAHDFLAQPGYVAFYKALALQSNSGGLAHVSHMEIAGDYVAGNWGLVHKKRFYYLLVSYDALKFGRYTPGVQALVETMRWAVDEGITVFDFTIGDERYKDEWCEISIYLHDHLTAKTLRGSVFLLLTRLVLALKRKIKQTPILWENFIKLRVKFRTR
jgi:CelD/BcsL family acetyltransferase involved in cellulose biosynthesis